MAPRREDFGSWLEGTPGTREPRESSTLGLPSQGSGSLAPVGRRVVALVVDWALSMAVASIFWPEPGQSGVLAAQSWATLAVFAGSTAVFVSLLGHTLGHRLLGLRVVRLAVDPEGVRRPLPGPPGLLAGAVRTALLCLVIPPVVWNRDGRGLHDLAASTAIVRR
ncbi:RDD family protein [Actinotalea sp. M2MS4P-6]|uniref:RDD family protein n=1 Tax=Actinotalea sp. M2MS4P-6 TaxID=2983762 RepID=UPI0021E462B7|nr:RDD family protein [Actinotalea sp. M2MS4P-6]MCV2393769.1 RDD family protein [Actinotalea sp. M2MS4P-6]